MSWVERQLERHLPGVGLRPLLYTGVAALSLTAYRQLYDPALMPSAFVEGVTAITGVSLPGFHVKAWSHAVALVTLMGIPALMMRLDGMRLGEMGLRLRGTRSEFELVALIWLLFLPALSWASGTAGIAATYPRLDAIRTDAGLFAIYELAYLVKWVAWEFFFRGFLLLGFERDFGKQAMLLSTLPYVVVHWNKPGLEMAGSLVAGLLLCWLTRRGRSIWPGVLLHATVAATMDFLTSTWWQT